MEVESFIMSALAEDVGPGDYSSLASIPDNQSSRAKLLAKENGIIAGVELAEKIVKLVDDEIQIDFIKNDGDTINVGDIILVLYGNARSILKLERLMLNCMQRMSGIATKTNSVIKLLDGLSTKVTDTRKTTPNMRFLEKWAVRIGGGHNHRFGLYDMIMLKDNHIDFAGGIKEAIEKTKLYKIENNIAIKVEIETRNLDEVAEVLKVGFVDRIMLDNFSVDNLYKAIQIIDGRFETEASGGITEETIRAYAETGVNYISLGLLTHSVKSLDLSLKAF